MSNYRLVSADYSNFVCSNGVTKVDADTLSFPYSNANEALATMTYTFSTAVPCVSFDISAELTDYALSDEAGLFIRLTINGTTEVTIPIISFVYQQDWYSFFSAVSVDVEAVMSVKVDIYGKNEYSTKATQFNRLNVVMSNNESDTTAVEELSNTVADLSTHVDTISANYVSTQTLNANYITATDINTYFLKASVAELTYATIATLEADYAKISTLESDYVKTSVLQANYATVSTIDATYAKINLANVEAGSITNAMLGTAIVDTTNIKDASITDGKIIGLTATKLTAGTIDASYISVINLNCANLTVGTINGTQIASNAINYKHIASAAVTSITNTISIGGRNLVLKSAFGSDLLRAWVSVGGSVSGNYLAHNAFYCDNSQATSGYIDMLRQNIDVSGSRFKPSTWYTLSFYIKGTGSITSYVYPSMIDTGGNTLVDNVTTTLYGDGSRIWLLTDTWVRHTLTFKTQSALTTASYLLFRVMYGNAVYICMPKIEEGNKATDWTPAPEDIDANINTVSVAAQAAQSTADAANLAANAAQADASNALNQLTNLTSDSILSASEKPAQRQEWNIISAEKAGIDTQATSFGITTEKTTYDNAFQVLATYLNAGTTWASGVPAWLSDAALATNTTIVGATYRSNWQTFYTARTELLQAISTKAKALADAAAVTANTANTAINNLSIGGRNYFKNSNFELSGTLSSYGYSTVNSATTGTDTTIKYLGTKSLKITFTDSVTGASGFSAGYAKKLSTQYTISGYVYCANATTVVIRPASNSCGSLGDKTISVPAGVWMKFVHTFTTASDVVGQKFVMFLRNSASMVDTWYFDNLKLEEGNKATDWSPAPEDVDANIAVVQTSANVAQSSADAANLSASAAQTTANTANTAINNLSIGGRNFLLNSSFDNSLVNWSQYNQSGSNTVVTGYNSHKAINITRSGYIGVSRQGVSQAMTIPISAGDTYILSAWVKVDTALTADNNQIFLRTSVDSPCITIPASTPTGIWVKFVSTPFTVTTTSTSQTLYILLGLNGTINVSNVKLEKGNKATDWSPAPEDVDASIAAVLTTADSKNTTYYQATAPSGGSYKTNDVWFDVDDGNKMYHYSGTSWTATQFGSNAIVASAITAEKIAASAVTAGAIAVGAVTSDKIIANAITSDKIATNAITSDKILTNAITADKIAANSVNTDKLVAGSVVSAVIASYAITTDKIAVGAINAGTIATNAITADKISANAITADKLYAGNGGNLYCNGYDIFEQVTSECLYYIISPGTAAEVCHDTAYYGNSCLKITAVGQDDFVLLGHATTRYGCIPVVPGKMYRISAYVKAASGSLTARMYVISHTAIDTVNSGPSDTYASIGTAWTRIEYTYTANSSYPYISLRFDVINTPGSIMYVDAIMIEPVVSATQVAGEFKPAGQTIINGANIVTGSILANSIATGTITATKINLTDLFAQSIMATGTITGLKLKSTYIESTSGLIGGFNLGSTALYNGTTTLAGATDSVYLGLDGISCGTAFKVTRAGAVTATSGLIGGFNVGATYLANNTTTLASAVNSVYLGLDGISCGTAFKVTKAGALTCTNAVLTGSIASYWAPETYGTKYGCVLNAGTLVITAPADDTDDMHISLTADGVKVYSEYTDGSQTDTTFLTTDGFSIVETVGSSTSGVYASSGSISLIEDGNSVVIIDTGHGITSKHVSVGGYANTSYALSTESFICNSWIRTVGDTGWYNETYGGGWYMQDSEFIRIRGNKKLAVDNPLYMLNADIGFNREHGLSSLETGAWLIRLNNATNYSNLVSVGDSEFFVSIYTNGNVWKNGSTTTYFATTSTSDRRLKDYVSDMSVYEDVFMELKPIAFKYHDGLYNAPSKRPLIQWGYYAQDVVEAFTKHGIDWTQQELVVLEDGELTAEEQKYVNNGMLKMNYQNISALHTHMLQKHETEIDLLKEKVINLQIQITALECDLNVAISA